MGIWLFGSEWKNIAGTYVSDPRVLLLIESSRAYGRGCLAGIAAYLRNHRPWVVCHLERSLDQGVPEAVQQQSFDGVIARLEDHRMLRTIERMGVPAIDIRGVFCPDRGASFDTDPHGCAEMAWKHFRHRGYRSFAFCGYPGLKFSQQRCDHFCRFASDEGFGVDIFGVDASGLDASGIDASGGDVLSGDPESLTGAIDEQTVQKELSGELDDHKLAKWLHRIIKPAAVLACNDIRGRQVLSAAATAGLKVPDQLAVLGIDDDEVICDLCQPPLSSIEPDTWRIGFEAAALLQRLMDGGPPPNERILIPPSRISVRPSTDILMFEDRDVVAALNYIREHAADGIGVSDVVRNVAVSRATLERKFRRMLDRTPREEIERIRVERIRMLLLETTYSLDKIALMSGYKTANHLITSFRRVTGCTPGQLRKNPSGDGPME